MPSAKDIAESAWLAVTARFAMIATIPALALITWLGAQWLDGRFDAQAQQTQSVAVRVTSLETDDLPTKIGSLDTRIALVERNQVTGKEARETAQVAQAAAIDKLSDQVDKLRSQNTDILQQLSAISATLGVDNKAAARPR